MVWTAPNSSSAPVAAVKLTYANENAAAYTNSASAEAQLPPSTALPSRIRTAPSALNAQEVDIVVALSEGAYRFDAVSHALELVGAKDLRRLTGYQDFVDAAPLGLVYLADHARMNRVPVAQRLSFASVAAGAIAQNVYLFAASAGLVIAIRAWIDREAIAHALGIPHDQEVLLSQTVGFGKG